MYAVAMVQFYELSEVVEIVRANPRPMYAGTAVLVLIGAIQYFLGPKQDWVEDYRAKFLRSIHESLSLFGAYGIGQSNEHERAMTISVDTEALEDKQSASDVVEEKLYRAGFHRNILACKKYRLHNGARQWSAGSWVHRKKLLSNRQLHATIFKDGVEDGVASFGIYVHNEYSNVRHPIEHVLSNGMEIEEARVQVRELFQEAKIEFTVGTEGNSKPDDGGSSQEVEPIA